MSWQLQPRCLPGVSGHYSNLSKIEYLGHVLVFYFKQSRKFQFFYICIYYFLNIISTSGLLEFLHFYVILILLLVLSKYLWISLDWNIFLDPVLPISWVHMSKMWVPLLFSVVWTDKRLANKQLRKRHSLTVAIKCNKTQVKCPSCHSKIQPIDFLPTKEKHGLPLTTDSLERKYHPKNCRKECPM